MSWYRNNYGFTFVEMIIAFSVFLLIISFFPIGLRFIYQDEFVEDSLQSMEWEVFQAQLKKEIRMSEDVTVGSNKLTLRKNEQTILYEKYGASIRRRVDFKGHEIVMQNVKSVAFEKLMKGVQIVVVTTLDQTKMTIIRTLVDMESYNGP